VIAFALKTKWGCRAAGSDAGDTCCDFALAIFDEIPSKFGSSGKLDNPLIT
jgi:hypothetical protein